MRHSIVLVWVVGLLGLGTAIGQSAAPAAATTAKPLAFDVVSIRLNKSGGPQKFGPTSSGYRMTNLFVEMPIVTAFVPQAGGSAHYPPEQIVGLPDWVMNDRYDIDAKVSEADLPDWQNPAKQRVMLRAMLQQMLEDRFKLVVHRSSKDVPAYSLSMGKNGPKFKQTNPNEPHPSGITHPEGGVTVPEVRDGQSGGHCFGCSMSLLAWFLSEWAGRPVQNETGLTGEYDFWFPQPAAINATSADSGPSVFTVVEELGLKLVPAKRSVETLVIDHVERPSEN